MSLTFWLGTHQPHWLGRVDVPLFVSDRRLRDRRSLPRASAPWALDSGGFTELSMRGRWPERAAEDYAERITWYRQGVGQLAWAAPQDWMCEPHVLAMTGLPVRAHQERTVESFLLLRSLAPEVVPVLQGWTLPDYHACADLYERAGVDLTAEPVVGVGSVCRRQHTAEIGTIMASLAGRGLRLHGFGVKVDGLARYGRYLASSDSMAWSYSARRDPPLPGCTAHKNCANCPIYALRWRDRLLAGLPPTDDQLTLGAAS